ncbi:MAG: beta-ketoacyl-[acyl-carrier-protein] synthase family protein [Candidatus Omnitrophica bacterium]|nr:beta-ketoacyl-[acyl-carrier-protein] synthase family protein [Candidatus Omnitrophota bacterium]
MLNIAITGLGVVAPAGIGKVQFWANVKNGRSAVSTIERFDASRYPSRIAGQIHQLDAYSHISGRLIKKIDDFSHMALITSELALQDAKIDLSKENLDRVGIFLGNAIGGWLYAETELRDLYLEGREGVSPFMASAWFPAAPQGQISIYYGIKGFSKTIVADRASSLQAIGYAAKNLQKGRADFILAGGTEAPVTPYALLCCNTNGSLSRNNDSPKTAYRPFDKNRDGFVIGEGSGMLILETKERAEKRGVPVFAYIKGFTANGDGYDRIKPNISGKELARAIQECLGDAGYRKEDIDYICLDGIATKEGDESEYNALKIVFDSYVNKIQMSAPKSIFGNLLGASGVMDVVATVMGMQSNLIPPMINCNDPDFDLDFVKDKARQKEIKKALVISRGRGGINTVLAIEKVNS